MGRDWYMSWVNKSSSKKRAATGTHSGRRSGRTTATLPPAVAAAAPTGGGCINVVLHLFDFDLLKLCFQPTPLNVNPGVQAPRNNLASLEEMVMNEPTSLASIIKDEKHGSSSLLVLGSRSDTKLKSVQAPRGNKKDYLSENATAPAMVRKPNPVARLMGLDILPESNTTTPRSSSSQPLYKPHVSSTRRRKSHDNDVVGPLESPPLSTRRRSMDIVDLQRRLSLQISKESSIVKEIESSRLSCSTITSTKTSKGKKYEEESKSPRYYARQIMKQAREKVSSTVGVDITNTIEQRDIKHRKDEHLLTLLTHHKKSNTKKKSTPNNENSSHLSYSKLVLKQSTLEEVILEPFDVISSKVTLRTKDNKDEKKHKKKLLDNNESCSKKPHSKSINCSIHNKKVEQFVRPSMNKKCKKMALSSNLLGSVPSLYIQGSSSKVGPPLKRFICVTETQLSRIPSQMYVKGTVKRTQTLKPCFEIKPCVLSSLKQDSQFCHQQQQETLNGFKSRELLCMGIRSYLSMDCQILENIDAFVEKDLVTSKAYSISVGIEEEGEAIVSEIECDIVDALVQEVVLCFGSYSSFMQRYGSSIRIQ